MKNYYTFWKLIQKVYWRRDEKTNTAMQMFKHNYSYTLSVSMEVQFIDRVMGAIAVCFVLKSIQADMSSDMFEYLFSKLFSVADFKSDG